MKDPAALFYTDNWYLATVGLKADERAYYLDLILVQFDKGDLPNDIEELGVICRVRHSEFENFKQKFEQVLKHKFELNPNGRLENAFAKEILRRREIFKQKRADAGKLSYILRFFRKRFEPSADLESFIKENIDLNIDTKNEQVLEQVFEHLSELYINGNGDGNGDINVLRKGGKGEKQSDSKPKDPKPDFIQQIIDVFKTKYKESRNLDFVVTNEGKERSAASWLLKQYKVKYPTANSEQTLLGLAGYFSLCMEVSDQFVYDNMSLSIIVNQFNKINNILNHGNKRKSGQPATSDSELVGIFAKHFATDYPGK